MKALAVLTAAIAVLLVLVAFGAALLAIWLDDLRWGNTAMLVALLATLTGGASGALWFEVRNG